MSHECNEDDALRLESLDGFPYNFAMLKKLLFLVAILAVPLVVHSDDMRRVSVDYHLDVEITGTSYPHIVWEGRGPLRYKWEKGEGRIMGGDIPAMTQWCPVAIPGYRAVMLTVQGRPGSVGVVKFENDDVVLSGAALELDVFDALPLVGAVAVPSPSDRKTLLHMSFPDLRMTSGEIVVDGKKIKGKLDSETMSAEVVFTTMIPKTGNAKLDDQIAGKTVIGKFRISLQNSYQK